MEEETINQKQGSYFTGTIGAILGGLVGAVPWIIAYIYGNMMLSILAVVIAIGEFYGYKLFKGKIDKKLPIILMVIAIITVSFTILFMIPAIMIYQHGMAVSVDSLKYVYSLEDFSSGIIRDLLISVLFTLLGARVVTSNIRKQLNQGTGEELKIKLGGELEEKRKQSIEVIKPIFEKYGAMDQEHTMMQEEVLAEIEDKNKALMSFINLKQCGAIKKHKGKFYYCEKNEGTKDIKALKTFWKVAFAIFVVAIVLSMIVRANNTYNDISNGLIEYRISKNWTAMEEEYSFYEESYYRYINSTPAQEGSNVTATDPEHYPATLNVYCEMVDRTEISSIEDIKTTTESYIQSSENGYNYQIDIIKTKRGYDALYVSVEPSETAEFYEKDYIILKDNFLIYITAISYQEKDKIELSKDAKSIADSLICEPSEEAIKQYQQEVDYLKLLLQQYQNQNTTEEVVEE